MELELRASSLESLGVAFLLIKTYTDTHIMSKRLQKRRGLLQSDEKASNGARTLTPLDDVLGGCSRGVPKMGPTLPFYFYIFGCFGGVEGRHRGNGHTVRS